MSLSPPTKDEDVYSEYEVSIIRGHFAVLEAPHTELVQQMATMHTISTELAAAQRGTAWLAANMPAAGAPDTLNQAALAAQRGQSLVLSEIAEYTQQLAGRIVTERMQIYMRLAKVPPPTSPPSAPLQGCDARCALRASLAGVGVLARQRCCGAYVCSACLHRYNFQHSAQAHLLHAPCFHCGKQRGIFAHFDPPPK